MKHALPLIFCLISVTAFSQELLPNPEFRQVNICCEYHVSCAPMGWWTAHGGTFNFKQNEFTADRRLKYKPAYYRYKSNVPGQRSYIQAPILCPLDSGRLYILEVLLRGEHYLPAQVGILFSEHYIQEKPKEIMVVDSLTGLFQRHRIDSILPHLPDTAMALNSARRNNKKQRVRFKYRAKGNERFIVIGNFKSDSFSAMTPRLFPLKKSDEALIEVYRVSLKAESGNFCNTKPQLNLLNKYNRRHTFYGQCRDTVARSMDLIFRNCKAWTPYYQKPEPKPESQKAFTYKEPFILENIFFAFDSSTLLPESYKALDSLLQVITSHKVKSLIVTGHTDSLGDKAYNDSLSLNRAKAVRTYLIKKIPELHIRIQGCGSRNPIKSNATPKGRARNRRVEITFLEE